MATTCDGHREKKKKGGGKKSVGGSWECGQYYLQEYSFSDPMSATFKPFQPFDTKISPFFPLRGCTAYVLWRYAVQKKPNKQTEAECHSLSNYARNKTQPVLLMYHLLLLAENEKPSAVLLFS